jgi:hypothetical protein
MREGQLRQSDRCETKLNNEDDTTVKVDGRCNGNSSGDTYAKTTFVKDEVEVAVEMGCRMIGANLNNNRFRDGLCPAFFANVRALFVPCSSRVLAEALTWQKEGTDVWYYFRDDAYTRLGYRLIGNTAILPPPPNPFGGGNIPPWAGQAANANPRALAQCLSMRFRSHNRRAWTI